MSKSALLIIVIIVLTGCTVAYYKTDDYLRSSIQKNDFESCAYNYFINISAERRQLTTGTKAMDHWAVEARKEYIESTEKVLKRHGCSANYVDNLDQANLLINIIISPYRSALPQEWLTGLSFGLIPSWGTRRSEYLYTFTNKTDSIKHSYAIDSVAFNHLVLFPVFWITFFTLDEKRAFERALSNFIENS